ncbi:MAG TPA: endonuclease domain-containing protein, partial [Sphingomicrobium sp.]|nr:endonuclease domain-containing protein [Sphingomicrobium sp.]
MSLPEVVLWHALRRRPDGQKFRRQFPVGPTTVDFVCLEKRVIIEVDGEAHNRGDQPRRDLARDAMLRKEGFTVLRIAAAAVLRDLDSVLTHIVLRCSEAGPHHQPLAGPPPPPGEDLP